MEQKNDTMRENDVISDISSTFYVLLLVSDLQRKMSIQMPDKVPTNMVDRRGFTMEGAHETWDKRSRVIIHALAIATAQNVTNVMT